MSHLTPRSFLGRFVLIAVIALLPLGLLGTVAYETSPSQGNDAARVANELDRLIQLRLNETFTLAALPSLRAFAASDVAARAQRATVALNELQAWVAADPPVREAFVVDRAGVSILSTSNDWNQNWIARAFVKRALAGRPDVSALAHDANEYSTYYAAPILDNRGEVAGALVARVAAQELWAPVYNASSKEGPYAVLVDENAVRLADGGDPSRNLVALAPLGVAAQTAVVQEQSYGSQVTIVRADNLERAAQLIRSGDVEAITPDDLQVPQVAARRMAFRPWTVLAVVPAPALSQALSRLVLPLGLAILGALAAAWVLER